MSSTKSGPFMKTSGIVLMIVAVAAVVGLLVWWGMLPESGRAIHTPSQPATAPAARVRIGLVPEYDVFALRRSHQELALYLSRRLGQQVEVRTLNTYEAVLLDLRERQVDAAFLGSLVAVLAMDRLGARVLAKPQTPEGISTYRGIIFVRADSPIRSLDDLRGRSIGMLKTTLAGSLFPVSEMVKRHMHEGPSACQIRWMGTHDDVIRAVVDGRVDVGAVKDLRLDAFEKRHPEVSIRRLAASEAVPNNALVIRHDVADTLGPRLAQVLLEMDKDPQATAALAALGAARFIPCKPEEYRVIYRLADAIGAAWDQVGVAGPALNRSGPRPATRP